MIKDEKEPIQSGEVDDYAHQVAAILVAGLIRINALQYASFIFNQVKGNGVFEEFRNRLYHHLAEALESSEAGIKKVHDMSAYMTGLSVEIESNIAKILLARMANGKTMDELSNLIDTREIFQTTATQLFEAMKVASQAILAAWKKDHDHRCLIAQIRREVCGAGHQEEPDKTLH
jgi:hypothetical protein